MKQEAENKNKLFGEQSQAVKLSKVIVIFLVWQFVIPLVSLFILTFFDGLAGTDFANENSWGIYLLMDLLTISMCLPILKNSQIDGSIDKGVLFFFPIAVPLAFCLGDFVSRGLALLPNTEEIFAQYEQMMGTIEGPVILEILVVVICGPIVEEFFFRGILYECLKQKYTIWIGIIISSLIFGGIHLNMLQFIDASIAGIVLCIIYEKTKKLVAPIFVHMVNNLISTLEIEFAAEAPLWVQILIILVEIVVVGAILIKFFLPLKEKEGVLEHEEQACSS